MAPWNNDLCYIFQKWGGFPQNGILAAVHATM